MEAEKNTWSEKSLPSINRLTIKLSLEFSQEVQEQRDACSKARREAKKKKAEKKKHAE